MITVANFIIFIHYLYFFSLFGFHEVLKDTADLLISSSKSLRFKKRKKDRFF